MSRDDHADIDNLYWILANKERRLVIDFIRELGGDCASLREITDYISDTTGNDRTVIETNLYHIHLPMLSDANLISYDRYTRLIQQINYI